VVRASRSDGSVVVELINDGDEAVLAAASVSSGRRAVGGSAVLLGPGEKAVWTLPQPGEGELVAAAFNACSGEVEDLRPVEPRPPRSRGLR